MWCVKRQQIPPTVTIAETPVVPPHLPYTDLRDSYLQNASVLGPDGNLAPGPSVRYDGSGRPTLGFLAHHEFNRLYGIKGFYTTKTRSFPFFKWWNGSLGLEYLFHRPIARLRDVTSCHAAVFRSHHLRREDRETW